MNANPPTADEAVAPYSYGFVDATIGLFFDRPEATNLTTRRADLSAGSSFYALYWRDEDTQIERKLVEVSLSMIDQAHTRMTVRHPDAQFIRTVIASLKEFLRSEMSRLRTLMEQPEDPDGTPAVSADQLIEEAAKNKGGRPYQTDDDWAWHEVHTHHRSAQTVRREWEKRNKDNARILLDESRGWRAAINKKRMEKRRRKPR